MEQRQRYPSVSPVLFKAMMSVEAALHEAVEPGLLHLVKLRASQINGCAYCIDMHWKDARSGGESEQRLYSLDAWRESPFYTEKERAALAWTEALTRIEETHAPDEDYAALLGHFSAKQAVDLSWAIAAINAWNRMGIGFRAAPGVVQARGAGGGGASARVTEVCSGL